MAKKKKPTKTAREYDRVMKQIKSQETYYARRGIRLPEVSSADFGGKTRSGLAALKKYKKQLQQTVKGYQSAAKQIAKEKGVDIREAYRRIAEQEAGIVSFGDVAIDNFYKIVDSWATRSSRETMFKFLNEIRSRVDDNDFTRVLQQTADQDSAMQELQYYHNYTEEQAIEQPLIFNMLAKFSSIGNLTKDEMRDKLGDMFSVYKAKGKYVKSYEL